jgi:hypothetical protein
MRVGRVGGAQPRAIRLVAWSAGVAIPESWDGAGAPSRRAWDGQVKADEEITMYARTSTWTGSAEALEKWVEHVAGTVAPMVAGLAGNVGAYFLLDRPGGRALTLTLI